MKSLKLARKAAMSLSVVAMLCGAGAAIAQQAPKIPVADQVQKEIYSPAEAKAVTLLLSSYHDLPDQALFEQASKAHRRILLDVAKDEQVFLLYRARALDALGRYWKDQDAFALIGQILNAESTKSGLKHRLIMSCAANYGEQARPLLAPFLDHKDPQLRETAKVAFRSIPSIF